MQHTSHQPNTGQGRLRYTLDGCGSPERFGSPRMSIKTRPSLWQRFRFAAGIAARNITRCPINTLSLRRPLLKSHLAKGAPIGGTGGGFYLAIWRPFSIKSVCRTNEDDVCDRLYSVSSFSGLCAACPGLEVIIS